MEEQRNAMNMDMEIEMLENKDKKKGKKDKKDKNKRKDELSPVRNNKLRQSYQPRAYK